MTSPDLKEALLDEVLAQQSMEIVLLDAKASCLHRFGAAAIMPAKVLESEQALFDAWPPLMGMEAHFEDMLEGERLSLVLKRVQFGGQNFDLALQRFDGGKNGFPKAVALLMLTHCDSSFSDRRDLVQTRNELALSHRALSQAQLAAENAAHAKSQFLATVADQVRSPLSLVLGNLAQLEDLSSRATSDPEHIKQAFGDANEAGGQILSLVSNLLELERATAGRIDLDLRPHDLWLWSDNLRTGLYGLTRQRQVLIELGQRLTGGYWFEPRLLKHILTSLLTNAIQFSSPGSSVYLDFEFVSTNRDTDQAGSFTFEQFRRVLPKKKDGTVYLTESAEPGWISFKVVDQGAGFSSHQLDELGQPFASRLDLDDRKVGLERHSGLELSLAFAYVKRLFGTLDFESEVGKGTLAKLRLPTWGINLDEPT